MALLGTANKPQSNTMHHTVVLKTALRIFIGYCGQYILFLYSMLQHFESPEGELGLLKKACEIRGDSVVLIVVV